MTTTTTAASQDQGLTEFMSLLMQVAPEDRADVLRELQAVADQFPAV